VVTQNWSGAVPECPVCRQELVVIGLRVDGSDLQMRSCAVCDTRTWHLGARPVDRRTALAQVGQASTRHRR
jgi:hypothetical protein